VTLAGIGEAGPEIVEAPVPRTGARGATMSVYFRDPGGDPGGDLGGDPVEIAQHDSA
jgi:hypothetical protein